MQVLNTGPHSRFQPLSLHNVKITGGFWREQQDTNRTVTLLDGYHKLEKAGNFDNLRHAAGLGDTPYRGPVFMDEDVYKWLEGVAYEIGNSGDPELIRLADETIALLAAAQEEDGYLDSYYQVVAPAKKWSDLDHGHEMYCAGHLIQAAVAHHRATGKTALLAIARRVADHIDSIFGPDKRLGTCGHPEIEMALVELYRETGERRYLDLAGFLVDQRGQGKMRGLGSYGADYHQDRVPVREAKVVEGHAVRQLYLTTGVTDIYLETGEDALFAAMERLWHDATTHKMFITGGYGSRFEGENFGDAYELSPDECYCETCAAIAGMMWNWRMLLATGEARYADTLERSLYNNFLSGIARDGSHYFYVNLMQTRSAMRRADWYDVACCPPNIMRQIAAVAQYIATTDEEGVQIHQYMPATIEVSGRRLLTIETDYPWDGKVRVTVEADAVAPWPLSLRVPDWCPDGRLLVNGADQGPVDAGAYTTIERSWQSGDVIELDMPLTPRLIRPNPRIDALRGTLSLARGPLVYCLEEIDQPADSDLLDISINSDASFSAEKRDDLLGGVVTIAVQGALRDDSWGDTLYRPLATEATPTSAPITLTAIPYYAWANREPSAMRVWIPRGE